MKLITEHIDQELEVICEAKKNGDKNYFIEGVFMQANQKNKNGRIYETFLFTQNRVFCHNMY